MIRYLLIFIFASAVALAQNLPCQSLFISGEDFRRYSKAQTVNEIINTIRIHKTRVEQRTKIINLLLSDPFLAPLINLQKAKLITKRILVFVSKDMGAELESDMISALARQSWFKYEIESIILDAIEFR